MAFIVKISESISSLIHSGSSIKPKEGLANKVASEIRIAGEKLKPLKEDVYGPKVMYDDLERCMIEKRAC